MLIYLILLGGLFLTALLDLLHPFNKKDANNIFWWWVFIFILFKGLRWDTGTDWSQFYACFENSTWSDIFSYWRYGKGTELMEPGYVFLNVLGRTFLFHYTFFLLVTNAFILIIYAKLIRKCIPKYYLVVLAVLIVSVDFFPVRQSLAIAIFCYSIKYVLNRDFKRFLFLCIISFTIHRSSLVVLVAFPLIYFQYSLKRTILIYLLVGVSSMLLYQAFDFLHNVALINALTGGIMDNYDAAGHYENVGQFEEIDTARRALTYVSSIVQLIVFSYPYYKYTHLYTYEREVYGFFLNLYSFWLCLNIIGYNPGFMMIYRIANNFSFAYPMVVGFSIFLYKLHGVKIVAFALFVTTFIIKLNTQIFMQPDNEHYSLFVPYKSFIDQGDYPRSGVWPYKQSPVN